MTKVVRMCVLVDSEYPATDGEGRPLLSHERGADRLAAALGALGHDVVTEEAPLSAFSGAKSGRWIVYFGADPEEALRQCGTERRAVESRLIVLDEDRVSAGELIGRLAIPLVVTSRSFRNWLSNPKVEAQVCGRPALARRVGIALDPDDAAQPAMLFTVPGVPLPEGLARCCGAVER